MPDIDVDQIGEALNNKMDRDLNNRSTTSGLRKLVASYIDGTEWCKVFAEIQSDGTTRQWCEQGGFVATGGTVTYLQPFIDNNYTVVAQSVETSTYTTQYRQICPNSKTTTGLTGTSAQGGSLWWYACGYISGTTISGSTAISIEPSNENTPTSGTVSNEVLQRITTLESEVVNMLGRPDYSAGIEGTLNGSGLNGQTGTYTCPSKGYLSMNAHGNSDGVPVRINGVKVALVWSAGEAAMFLPVSQGDILSRGSTSGGERFYFTFFPEVTL